MPHPPTSTSSASAHREEELNVMVATLKPDVIVFTGDFRQSLLHQR